MEDLLKENGTGIMTPVLQKLFFYNNCNPKCHICNKFIQLESNFRLKPFCEKRVANKKGEKKSLAIMVCGKCDEENKVLPYDELVKACEAFGFSLPEYEKKPEDYPRKLILYNRIKEKYKDSDDSHWKEGRWLLWSPENKIEHIDYTRLNSFHDLPYFRACDEYKMQIKKFRKKYEQFFDNEDYETYCLKEKARRDAAHRRYVASLPKGGCFVLTSGKTKTIIGGGK